MATGSKDRPPMLATGRYPQWYSRFLRYIDTTPNGEALRKCVLSGPYKPTTILVQVVEATDDSPAVPEHTTMKFTRLLMLAKQLRKCGKLLKGYNKEMWEAIKRLQQGESLNIQDVKTNLFLEFGKFTSHDGETMESYYTRFYKLMNEMIRNNLTVTTMQVNVQFLQQLQPEWSRSHTTTKHKGKEIAKPITPLSETTFEEDSDPEQAQRDKDMQNNLALISKYFKKIYKPTNNNIRTSSNSRNTNMDTTSRYKNDGHSGQFGNQRMVNVAGAREKVGSPVVQQLRVSQGEDIVEQGVPLQAEQYDWLADTDEEVDEQELEAHYSYMAMIQEVPTVETGTDSEPVEHVQNDDGYNVFSNDLQHSKQSESVSNTCLVETDDSNVIPDSPDMCEDDIQNDQNDVESDDEQTSQSLGESISVRDSCLVALQTKQTEFEKYKSFDDRTIDYDKLERKLNKALGQLAQKDTVIKEGLKTKAYELLVVKEKHDELIKQSLLTKSHYKGLVKQKTKIIMDLKLREEHDIEKMLSMEKQLKFLNEVVYKRSQSIQTIHMMAPKVSTYNSRPTFANPEYLKQAQFEISCLYAFPYDQSTHANRLIPEREETLAFERES
nr:hypothetical protein [Tanacetum cinerariifolium]